MALQPPTHFRLIKQVGHLQCLFVLNESLSLRILYKKQE